MSLVKMEETLSNCPICGSEMYIDYISNKGHVCMNEKCKCSWYGWGKYVANNSLKDFEQDKIDAYNRKLQEPLVDWLKYKISQVSNPDTKKAYQTVLNKVNNML